jgi:hypothetical protein
MKLIEITSHNRPFSGEYLFYEPAREIVLCGGYVGEEEKIRAILSGRLIEADATDFKKIELTREEHRARYVGKCKGCSK